MAFAVVIKRLLCKLEIIDYFVNFNYTGRFHRLHDIVGTSAHTLTYGHVFLNSFGTRIEIPGSEKQWFSAVWRIPFGS